MRYIRDIVKYFTFITTGIVIVLIVVLLMQGNDGISIRTLIGIPCLGLVTAIVTVFLYPSEASSKTEYGFRVFLHYLVLCVIISLFGILFGWISFNLNGILLMMVSTAMVYAFTYTVAYLSSKNDADKLNQALKNKHSRS